MNPIAGKISNEEKFRIMGLLIVISGFYKILHNNSKAIFNKNVENVCKILNGGHKTGKYNSHVIFVKGKKCKN